MNNKTTERIEELEKLIKHHNKKYFIENNPEISDEDFDLLYEELKSLKPDSPVLFEITGEIGTVEHSTPMLSIDKRYTYEDIKKWVIDTNDSNYIVEPKYDGMAARYQSGLLATRGDGKFGENISERLKFLKIVGNLPTDNSNAFGEIVIDLNYFNKNLSTAYKNPRNAAVGIIKAKNINPEGIKALTDKAVHFVIHDNGGKKLIVSKEDLLNEDKWEEILEEIFHSDYQLDGIVIKATSEEIKKNAGTTLHHEKWQVAYKAPAERKLSTVLEIKDQVGRTGRITSVAVIEPINLSGATVTNVTLHNYQYIVESKIDIGSQIEVCRSGEVIPFITKVFTPNKNHKQKYMIPTNCPICENLLKKDAKYLECTNPKCPAKFAQSIEYFFKTLKVDELGIKTIERFINEFKISNIIDFYDLSVEMISNLDGFGQKSAENITNNINHTLKQTITEEELLQSIGIKSIGPAASAWIINSYGFEKIPTLTYEEIQEIKGIGPQKAKLFVSEIKEKWQTIDKLLKMGLKFKQSKTSNKLLSLTFAITGKKETYSRDELIKIIKENGGEYKTAIVKDLSYLIAGEDAGSKSEKAQALGIKIINEQEFLDLLK
jgi:DNA ligase (NAD+)